MEANAATMRVRRPRWPMPRTANRTGQASSAEPFSVGVGAGDSKPHRSRAVASLAATSHHAEERVFEAFNLVGFQIERPATLVTWRGSRRPFDDRCRRNRDRPFGGSAGLEPHQLLAIFHHVSELPLPQASFRTGSCGLLCHGVLFAVSLARDASSIMGTVRLNESFAPSRLRLLPADPIAFPPRRAPRRLRTALFP